NERGGEFLRRPFNCFRLDRKRFLRSGALGHFGGHLVEGGAELAAEARHCGDGGNRDQGSNQAVFDGGRASFITKHALEKGHGSLLVCKSSVPGPLDLSIGRFPITGNSLMIY